MNPSSLPTETPAELAEKIRRGQREGEAELVERYSRGVRIVLQRHTRKRTDAEDLFQETFRLAVIKLRAGELRDPSKLAGFLSSLARNLATEHYRKAIRRKTEADSETVEAESRDSDDTASPARESGSPLRQLLRSEEAQLVRRILQELPTARDRELLFRFYLADEDKETIASDHGLDSLQFNRVLHRARQRYKELYLQHVGPAAARGTAGDVARLLLLLLAASWWSFFALWVRSAGGSHH